MVCFGKKNQVINIVLPPQASESPMQLLEGRKVVRVQLACPAARFSAFHSKYSRVSVSCPFSLINRNASDVVHGLDKLHRIGPFLQIPKWNDTCEKIVTLVVGHRKIHIVKAVSDIRADANSDSMLDDGKPNVEQSNTKCYIKSMEGSSLYVFMCAAWSHRVSSLPTEFPAAVNSLSEFLPLVLS
ncbi:PIM1 peptidase (S16 family) [Echinococcus granulosus]|uniref:PIM1 peptidase (S16 family) n=1 Tax=Echinococcus granulosus TaxID=6210 RepID=W6TZK5_ECHGR|nr:PIM1 peptidase (S16 family) [Echinococcus granulosus]EUB54168.1 PIM1 peptidase (S16 family) [Echinococcus granulosus]